MMKLRAKILLLFIIAIGLLSEGNLFAQSQNRLLTQFLKPQNNYNFTRSTTGTIIANQDYKSKKPSDNSAKVNIDTMNSNSRISRIWNDNEKYLVEVVLEDKNSKIELVAYNMFGKKVMDIVETGDDSNIRVYSFNATSLPNGVYLCVLQGRNIRDVEKFIVSR